METKFVIQDLKSPPHPLFLIKFLSEINEMHVLLIIMITEDEK